MKRWLALMTGLLLALLPVFSRAEAGEDAPSGRAIGYIRVTVGAQVGWLPVPEKGAYSYPLEQVLPDGSHALNVIRVTSEGVYMESSTCENQNCVEQGIVTFENLSSRVLSRYIICLPNQVMLELFTPEEAAALLAAGEEP
ncbi:MAG: NusG domain II-containing protein [Clostridia bacterium]|nr:NusG domain II-containing protein [Clostridia bacterium]